MSCQPPKHRFFIPIKLNLSSLPWGFAWLRTSNHTPMYTLVLLCKVLRGNFLWDETHQLFHQGKATYLPRVLLSSCCESMEVLHWEEEGSLKHDVKGEAWKLLQSKGIFLLAVWFFVFVFSWPKSHLPSRPAKRPEGIYVIQFGQYLPPWLELTGKLPQFWLVFFPSQKLVFWLEIVETFSQKFLQA